MLFNYCCCSDAVIPLMIATLGLVLVTVFAGSRISEMSDRRYESLK